MPAYSAATLPARLYMRQGRPRGRPQSADKAHNCGNCPDKREIGGNFCYFYSLHLHSAVICIHISSLGCKFVPMACRLFQHPASRPLCQHPGAAPGAALKRVPEMLKPPSPLFLFRPLADGTNLLIRAHAPSIGVADSPRRQPKGLPKHPNHPNHTFPGIKPLGFSDSGWMPSVLLQATSCGLGLFCHPCHNGRQEGMAPLCRFSPCSALRRLSASAGWRPVPYVNGKRQSEAHDGQGDQPIISHTATPLVQRGPQPNTIFFLPAGGSPPRIAYHIYYQYFCMDRNSRAGTLPCAALTCLASHAIITAGRDDASLLASPLC